MLIERLLGETRARLIALLRRSRSTINELAEGLRLTDNAVRSHVAALSRDGLVADVGVERDTGGKPARLYSLTVAGEEIFPKAYALVLGELITELRRADGGERASALLRAVGERIASQIHPGGDDESRVRAAAELLRGIGAELDVQRTEDGWRLTGHGCPLSAVTASHPEACAMASALVEQVTRMPTTACCERGDRPRCGFLLAAE